MTSKDRTRTPQSKNTLQAQSTHDPSSGLDMDVQLLLELNCNEPDDPCLINFHDVEYHNGLTFRWSEPVSMIRLEMAPAAARVTIDTGSLRSPELNFQYQLHWNDHLIPAKAISVENGKLSFDVHPGQCARICEQRLTITCKPLQAENGRRQLGMPVCSIRVETITSAPTGDILKFTSHSGHPSSGTKKKSWFKKKMPEPAIPIWQVRMPELQTASTKDTGHPSYPPCDRVIVSPCEINSRHGTGLLIQYLVQDMDQVATVNSMRIYNDDRVHSRVHHCLPNRQLTRHEIYDYCFNWFGDSPPRQAYVVPYGKNDLWVAMALKDLFQTQICIHVMDDNCVYGQEIPPEVAAEAFEKADLVLVISPEMRQAYEQRFGRKVWMLPPIVPNQLIPREVTSPSQALSALSAHSSHSATPNFASKAWNSIQGLLRRGKAGNVSPSGPRGILIGNIWDPAWLNLLRKTIRESGLQVDWYSNNPGAFWLKDSIEDIEKDGIFLHDSLWGQDLVDELRRRPFAIVPSGQLSGEGNRENIARLSLPSRVPFVVATAHLPVITLGSPETSAAKFVSRFQVGANAEYNGSELRKAVDLILRPDQQMEIRSKAHRIASTFAADSVESWLWESLDRRSPADDRFETLFPAQQSEFSWYFDPEPPQSVHWVFRDTWRLINRLKAQGLEPDLVIDVGASNGIWSWTTATIFPDAKFVMVDPMMSRYSQTERSYYLQSLKSYELVEAALSDHCGEADILVSNDLFGTSLLKVDDRTRRADVARVDVLTLDEVARRKRLRGRTLLKVDVQFAEHLVVQGGLDFIRNHVDAIILELTILREHPSAKTYREMLDMMEDLGFVLVDEMEGWRNPATGRLEQKDAVFIRNEKIKRQRVA